jgi:crotonobetainyl-CoA:carnitine CoA-transferase CaiB-like acyl-CoA transferase
MAGALEGIKVIDFGQYIAGPLCAMMLADQGAEVLHIDPPGGPSMRSPANACWNRGKRCLELDLTQARDRQIAWAWLEQADVLIENFRPGVMQRLGWGQSELRARYPQLIYCSLPGFASDDPRSSWPAWEGVVAAATDTYRPLTDGDDPAFLAVPVASNFAALQAATACVMALIARRRDGRGQHIEVPLFDSMFSLIGARGMSMPSPVKLSFDFTGFGIYRCSDGRDVHFAPVGKRFLGWFIDAAGVGHWREQGLLERDRLASEPELAIELRCRLTALFLTRPSEHWQALAAAAGAPLAVCHTMAQWLLHPHARQSGAIVEVNDPQLGATLQPGVGVRLSAFEALRPQPRRLEAPDSETGWSVKPGAARKPQAAQNSLEQPRAGPLKGIRVLDLTQIWAGPTGARLLAEYGADVIKVNEPNEPILTHEDVNRGKRSLLLDLQSREGLETAKDLISTSDVVLQNFARGVAERLGIGPNQARALRPDLIYASVSAYGYEGPWGERRGYEVQAQACVGAQVQFGGIKGAQRVPYELNDYGTGIMTAFAIGLGLWHRLRTGSGQDVHAALSFTAGLHQSLFLLGQTVRSASRTITQAPGNGQADPLPGQTAWQSLYRTRDGWLFLGVHPRDEPTQQALCAALEIADSNIGHLGQLIAQRLAGQSSSHWVALLIPLGVGVHPLVSVASLMSDRWVRAHGLSLSRHHPGLGEVTTTGPVVRMSATPVHPGKIASAPGADLAEVLAEVAGLRRPPTLS